MRKNKINTENSGNYTSIGENIKKIRVAKGWSRERIIKITGISNLYMKESGLRKITEQDINKLAKALECSKSEIVGDVDFKMSNPKHI
jgi:transcriptional regulator with XRE-family HTH domain